MTGFAAYTTAAGRSLQREWDLSNSGAG